MFVKVNDRTIINTDHIECIVNPTSLGDIRAYLNGADNGVVVSLDRYHDLQQAIETENYIRSLVVPSQPETCESATEESAEEPAAPKTHRRGKKA